MTTGRSLAFVHRLDGEYYILLSAGLSVRHQAPARIQKLEYLQELVRLFPLVFTLLQVQLESNTNVDIISRDTLLPSVVKVRLDPVMALCRDQL